jgi:hypothetical protein
MPSPSSGPKTASFSEMPASTNQSTWWLNRKKHNQNCHCCKNFKSNKAVACLICISHYCVWRIDGTEILADSCLFLSNQHHTPGLYDMEQWIIPIEINKKSSKLYFTLISFLNPGSDTWVSHYQKPNTNFKFSLSLYEKTKNKCKKEY